MLQNENEHNEERASEATLDLYDSIAALWIAGTTVENIVVELCEALKAVPGLPEHIKVGLRT